MSDPSKRRRPSRTPAVVKYILGVLSVIVDAFVGATRSVFPGSDPHHSCCEMTKVGIHVYISCSALPHQ